MAQSPASAHRARLIREMSRELNSAPRPRTSEQSQNGGSPGNTTFDFDPENEAIMSTRQFDNTSQQLPELRASAQKYARYTRRDPSFVVDTSAMKNAFLDFTQAGPSDSDNESISIEIGRGLKNTGGDSISKLKQSREFSSDVASSVGDDSFDLTLPKVGDYQVMYTPPNRPKSKSSSKKEKKAPPGSLQRAAQVNASSTPKQTLDKSPPLAKMTEYNLGQNKESSEIQQRSSAPMRARVRDENDISIMSDERPSTLNLTSRSTRFGNGQATQIPPTAVLPFKFSATKNFNSAENSKKQAKADFHKQNATLTSSTNPATKQSFMIPDMPNLSELVSGVFQDGTPVFSQGGKQQSSRFAPTSSRQANIKTKPSHPIVQEIRVPQDEHDIYVSLQVLQDRVGELEVEGAETKATMNDLKQKNQILEHEKAEGRKWRRSDSALGTTDGSDAGDDAQKGSRRWSIEKTRLESTVKMLQQQLDFANQKYSTAEATIRTIAQERDSAVSQLGVAYLTQEKIKDENESLRHENEKLKRKNESLKDENFKLEAEFTHITANQEDQSKKWQKREEALRKKIQRRDEIVQALRGTKTSADASLFKQSGPNHGKCMEITSQVQPIATEVPKQSIPRQDKENLDGYIQNPQSTPKRADQFEERPLPASVRISRGKSIEPQSLKKELPKLRDDTVMTGTSLDTETSEDSISELVAARRGLRDTPSKTNLVSTEHDEVSEDLTYQSLIDSLQTAKHRQALDPEQPASMQRVSEDVTNIKQMMDALSKTQAVTTEPVVAPDIPRKSAMKDVTGTFGEANYTGDSQDQADETIHTNASITRHRRHSEDSLLHQRNRRQGLGMEDMTSAFLVPDITIRHPVTEAKASQKLSLDAEQVFNGLAAHNGKNCTICTRIIEEGAPHDHNEPAKKTIRIPKPVPVSDRMPESRLYEDEPTMRPSQLPSLALATVMKGLEDELAHLRIRLSQYQTIYCQHDPSLSKRKRKAIYAKIESVLQAIDTKSDQIYALYDVLEGQKADGHEIDEQEVEVTLQSIGIDVSGLELRGGELPGPDTGAGDARHPWELSSDESDEELPWEGIENTQGTAKSSINNRRRSCV